MKKLEILTTLVVCQNGFPLFSMGSGLGLEEAQKAAELHARTHPLPGGSTVDSRQVVEPVSGIYGYANTAYHVQKVPVNYDHRWPSVKKAGDGYAAFLYIEVQSHSSEARPSERLLSDYDAPTWADFVQLGDGSWLLKEFPWRKPSFSQEEFVEVLIRLFPKGSSWRALWAGSGAGDQMKTFEKLLAEQTWRPTPRVRPPTL